ncbi:MAG TPA: GNAT family N-acetyltransferase [Ktedonobacteraceae bacterium]|nr:GNAT family N-acetyltransferase [Ktedonobacteraceae bacterium]
MTQPTAHWCITLDATNDEAYAILSQDPIWNCFALADLELPLRDYSQFALAYQNESNKRAICLILRHPIIGQVLSPFGPEEGVAAILKHLALPEHPLIQAQEMHIPILQHYYQPETNWKGMWRMAVTPTTFQPLIGEPPRQVKRLTTSDLPALKNLYAQHLESTFSANLFSQGVYVGVWKGKRLIAAGGTHALAPTSHIAVLGNILTAPEARGQGYATAITAALVIMLFDQGYSTIVLNVFEDNSSAIRIYQRLGFHLHRRLLTGKALVSR